MLDDAERRHHVVGRDCHLPAPVQRRPVGGRVGNTVQRVELDFAFPGDPHDSQVKRATRKRQSRAPYRESKNILTPSRNICTAMTVRTMPINRSHATNPRRPSMRLRAGENIRIAAVTIQAMARAAPVCQR